MGMDCPITGTAFWKRSITAMNESRMTKTPPAQELSRNVAPPAIKRGAMRRSEADARRLACTLSHPMRRMRRMLQA